MPALLSHYRPDDQIFAFTESRAVQRRLALYHGVTALHMRFGETADETFDRCVSLLGLHGRRGRCVCMCLLFWDWKGGAEGWGHNAQQFSASSRGYGEWV